jgi:hypothetical protein
MPGGLATPRYVGGRHLEGRISPRRRPRLGRLILTPCLNASRRTAGRLRLADRSPRNVIATGFSPDLGAAGHRGRRASWESNGHRARRHGRRASTPQRPHLDAGPSASVRRAASLVGAGRGESSRRSRAGRLGLRRSIRSGQTPTVLLPRATLMPIAKQGRSPRIVAKVWAPAPEREAVVQPPAAVAKALSPAASSPLAWPSPSFDRSPFPFLLRGFP